MTMCVSASTGEGSKGQLWLFSYSYFTKAVGVPPPPPHLNTHGPEVTMMLRTRSKPRSPRFTNQLPRWHSGKESTCSSGGARDVGRSMSQDCPLE